MSIYFEQITRFCEQKSQGAIRPEKTSDEQMSDERMSKFPTLTNDTDQDSATLGHSNFWQLG